MASTTQEAPKTIRPALVRLMAFAVCVLVANGYYAQPVLSDIARTFDLTVVGAGRFATLIQIGISLGLFVFVPLGDILERRQLSIRLILASAFAMAIMATAQTSIIFGIGCFLLGTSVSAVHVLIPFAASLASPETRGAVVGKVFSGLLMGILLARTFSGMVASVFGWRSVFGIACVLMVGLSGLIRFQLPQSTPTASVGWVELIRSIPQLWRELPVWREACWTGMLVFATFAAFWTTLVFFLESPGYGYGSREAGLFGLVGVAGALCAPLVGKLADRSGARRSVFVGLVVNLLAWVVMGLAGKVLDGLIVGVVLMDLAVQTVQVSNQARIYALRPDARSRINMVYMTLYFVGASVGSFVGTACWHQFGWTGVCVFSGIMTVAAMAVHAGFAQR